MPETITPNFTLEINRKLEEIFNDVQSAKDVVIPSSIRTLCESIMNESLTLRKQEWVDREGLNVDDYNDMEEAITRLESSIRNLFYDIEIEKSEVGESLNFISLYSFLREINSKWCEIFPFC